MYRNSAPGTSVVQAAARVYATSDAKGGERARARIGRVGGAGSVCAEMGSVGAQTSDAGPVYRLGAHRRLGPILSPSSSSPLRLPSARSCLPADPGPRRRRGSGRGRDAASSLVSSHGCAGCTGTWLTRCGRYKAISTNRYAGFERGTYRCAPCRVGAPVDGSACPAYRTWRGCVCGRVHRRRSGGYLSVSRRERGVDSPRTAGPRRNRRLRWKVVVTRFARRLLVLTSKR